MNCLFSCVVKQPNYVPNIICQLGPWHLSIYFFNYSAAAAPFVYISFDFTIECASRTALSKTSSAQSI